MKKYVIKYFLFLAPFVVAVFIEVVFLPTDFFTFRVWEALSVKRSLGVLKGPFYPNNFVAKNEKGGDLAAHSSCALKKKDVIWITDKYGYRKANVSVEKFPIIIVGDSNIAGAGLTQDDMLSEVLEKKLRRPVYPIAPRALKHIFSHGLLKQSFPEIVILASIERNILTLNLSLPRGDNFGEVSFWEETVSEILTNSFIQEAAIKTDRAIKSNMLHYLRTRINRLNNTAEKEIVEPQCPILFLQGAAANKSVPAEKIDAVAQNIKRCSDYFNRRGIRFIFLPLPNKENIYYQQLGTARPLFLSHLIKKLEEMNVEVVNAQKAFDEVSKKSNKMLYHRDDTHWSAEGVNLAAELLEELIQKKPKHISRNK